MVDPSHFRKVLGHFPTGVTIVAAHHNGEPVGLAVGSFFSISLDPPLVGFCVGHTSTSWPRIAEAGKFCINVLAESQRDVSTVFATKGADKFSSVAFDAAPLTASPRLSGGVAWLDCELDVTHRAGDHDIVVARVLDLDVDAGATPLVFVQGGYRELV